MPKKQESTDMAPVAQRRYTRDVGYGKSNAIPRCEEHDLAPDPRGGEQSFFAPKGGNAMWEEKDRP